MLDAGLGWADGRVTGSWSWSSLVSVDAGRKLASAEGLWDGSELRKYGE